jgi:hypothetical protein
MVRDQEEALSCCQIDGSHLAPFEDKTYETFISIYDTHFYTDDPQKDFKKLTSDLNSLTSIPFVKFCKNVFFVKKWSIISKIDVEKKFEKIIPNFNSPPSITLRSSFIKILIINN